MDQKINDYLEKLVADVLASPMFVNLPDDQKSALIPKIKTYFDGVVIDTLIEHLTAEQLNVINNLPADSPEMEDKIEEYAATIPSLAESTEEQLTQAIIDIKQNPQKLG